VKKLPSDFDILVDADEPVVHPVIHELRLVRAFGLGDLVLVVRELEVLPAAVDVEMSAEQAVRHDRALDMPARPTFTPRRIPRGLALFRLLPEHEVERIVLRRADLDALAGAQIVERLPRKLPVAGKLPHGIVHVAVIGQIGELAGLENVDHFEHAVDVLRRARLEIGLFDAERRGVFVHRLDETGGECVDRLVVFECAPDDLVVDIRDIAHVRELVTRGAQPALHHIEHHHHPRVPQMAVVVNRHSADVHADFARRDWQEILLLPRERVINLQHAVTEAGKRAERG
jgi:hypothetical protein